VRRVRSIKHPRQKIEIAALAIGFWSAPAKGRQRAVVRAFEAIPFPKSSGPYTVEFPILLNGNE